MLAPDPAAASASHAAEALHPQSSTAAPSEPPPEAQATEPPPAQAASPTAQPAPQPFLPPTVEGALGAEPLEALPEGFWGDEDAALPEAPASDATDDPLAGDAVGAEASAGGAPPTGALATEEAPDGVLLEHPRFRALQKIFPGRLLSYHADSPADGELDESDLTDEGATDAIDFEESDDEGEP